jgi:hypothetical protein
VLRAPEFTSFIFLPTLRSSQLLQQTEVVQQDGVSELEKMAGLLLIANGTILNLKPTNSLLPFVRSVSTSSQAHNHRDSRIYAFKFWCLRAYRRSDDAT